MGAHYNIVPDQLRPLTAWELLPYIYRKVTADRDLEPGARACATPSNLHFQTDTFLRADVSEHLHPPQTSKCLLPGAAFRLGILGASCSGRFSSSKSHGGPTR